MSTTCTFPTHTSDGKRSDLTVYDDRVEFHRKPLIGREVTDMLPMGAISSVSIQRGGLRSKVVIATSSETVEVFASKHDAEAIKSLVLAKIT